MYRFVQLMVADAKNSSEDTEMITVACANNDESNIHPSDESAVVPTLITNVGIASSCTGNVTSGASLGNLLLDSTTAETKSFGTLSGSTDLADSEILSNGHQQQVKKNCLYLCLLFFFCCIFI
jgi:exosome complex exonuclease RRP6